MRALVLFAVLLVACGSQPRDGANAAADAGAEVGGPRPSPDAGSEPDAAPDMAAPKLGPGEVCTEGACARGAEAA